MFRVDCVLYLVVLVELELKELENRKNRTFGTRWEEKWKSSLVLGTIHTKSDLYNYKNLFVVPYEHALEDRLGGLRV